MTTSSPYRLRTTGPSARSAIETRRIEQYAPRNARHVQNRALSRARRKSTCDVAFGVALYVPRKYIIPMNNAAVTALRDIKYPTVRYGWIALAFTREFTSGTLAGLTHSDSIGFCSEAAAAEWVSTINRKNAAGEVDYKIVKWSVAS
jgi:hypothetical protein